MLDPNIQAAAAAGVRMTSELFRVQLEESAVAEVIEDVLWGARELLVAARDGLVTNQEVVSAVIQHIHTRLISPVSDLDVPDWSEAARPLGVALLRLLPP